jgi:hypothetical protein
MALVPLINKNDPRLCEYSDCAPGADILAARRGMVRGSVRESFEECNLLTRLSDFPLASDELPETDGGLLDLNILVLFLFWVLRCHFPLVCIQAGGSCIWERGKGCDPTNSASLAT